MKKEIPSPVTPTTSPPLGRVASHSSLEWSKLLDLGFSPVYERDEGESAIYIASQGRFKNEEMVKLMKKYVSQHSLDSDITTNRGELLHGDIINYEITDYL